MRDDLMPNCEADEDWIPPLTRLSLDLDGDRVRMDSNRFLC